MLLRVMPLALALTVALSEQAHGPEHVELPDADGLLNGIHEGTAARPRFVGAGEGRRS
jgi:hypothetical protein